MSQSNVNKHAFQEKYRIANILSNNDDTIKFTDFENFFNIYQDENGYYRYNINSTVYLQVPPSRLKTHKVQHDMHWPTISYQLYGTVRLAWVLMKVNNITPDISFSVVPAGSEIKYLDRNDITTIIDSFSKED